MLFEKIRKRLVGQLLEGLHAVTRQQIERVPRLVVDLDAFTGHG